MKPVVLAIALGISSIVCPQVHIIPEPVEMKTGNGHLSLREPVGCIYNRSAPGDHSVSFLKEYLSEYYKISAFSSGDTQNNGYSTEIFIDYDEHYQPENGYELKVEAKGISLKGRQSGLFYAVQTLIQLLPVQEPSAGATDGPIRIPFITIRDYPRLPYRGLHLDVGRHFFPVAFIKKYIDFIALHKLNYFHWHLTEDQGWRIEIKKYPRLTEVGAWRNGTIIGRYPGSGNDKTRHGGFYTQEDVKEIVQYAADRFITVIPEIEMPGHGSAAIAAYPELSCFPEEPTFKYFPPNCEWYGEKTGKQVQQTWGVFDDVFCAGKESTFKFLEDVLDEVIPLFPGKYFHVGGDECPKANWKRCPNCQQRIRDQHLKGEHELQSYFINRMEKYLNSRGKTLIGWDEILEGGLAPNAIVMSWRGEAGGIEAARQKHEVIMTPGNPVYFDHTQSENEDSVTIGGYNPLEKVYTYEPVPAVLGIEEGKFVLGAQANVWTEYMTNPDKVEYMIFPRLAALSEVLWSPKEKRNPEQFEMKLETQFKRYDLWKADYSRAFYDLKAYVLPSPDNKGVLWKLESRQNKGYIGYAPANESPLTIKYRSPVRISKTGIFRASYLLNDKAITTVSQQFYFNKATGKQISLSTAPSRNYPGDGAFTLVNGVQNERGLGRSREFLGWSGDDMEAVIDLGSAQPVKQVIVHTLSSGGSWVHPPAYAEAFASVDGKNFKPIGKSESFEKTSGSNGVIRINTGSAVSRYLKVIAKNKGIIPEGNAGAGNKAWLFVDEIEID